MKVSCGKSDVTVTLVKIDLLRRERNGLISTTGSNACVTRDERLQLRAAIECAPTLSYLLYIEKNTRG